MSYIEVTGSVTNLESFLSPDKHFNSSVIIVHQVNIKGIMGGGVAKSLAQKYSPLLLDYQSFIANYADFRKKEFTEPLFGEVFLYRDRTQPLEYVANIFAQSLGTSVRQTNYEALYTGLVKTFKLVDMYQLPNPIFAIPKNIGCGLGGGDWNVVSALIKSAMEHVNVKAQVYVVAFKTK